VSLPAGQKQVLDRIETDLEGCEPKLRSMFAIFTRLTRDDGAPRTESLPPRWTWPHRGLTATLCTIMVVSLALGLAVFFVLAAISNSVAPGCQRMATPIRAAASCQSAKMPGARLSKSADGGGQSRR
jgi:hypothetical protein